MLLNDDFHWFLIYTASLIMNEMKGNYIPSDTFKSISIKSNHIFLSLPLDGRPEDKEEQEREPLKNAKNQNGMEMA